MVAIDPRTQGTSIGQLALSVFSLVWFANIVRFAVFLFSPLFFVILNHLSMSPVTTEASVADLKKRLDLFLTLSQSSIHNWEEKSAI